jgi:aminopeptidase N
VAIHVLYRPGDLDWDAGAAAARTVRALEWLEGIFGPYPYPQLTNLHRLDGGGTEFPMVIMDGGPGQGLITHETAHQWAMGILGSNEWREAWLDEGMATFLTNWFTEDVTGQDPWTNNVVRVAQVEGRGGVGVPIGTVSEEMPSYGAYGFLSYTKPGVVLYMLRELVGPETMRRALRLYAERKSFEHVTEADLRAAVEDASGRELGWFFEQWIHSTATLDWAVVEARTRRDGQGWATSVTLRVGDVDQLVEDRSPRVVVEVRTDSAPETVEADPDVVLLDVDRTNNRAPVTR